MKNTLVLILFLFLLACREKASNNPPADATPAPIPVTNTNLMAESIEGERINGPANIRDTINGEILFSLHDSTLVSCTEVNDGWYAIGLFMDLPISDFEKDTLVKGTKIIVDGKQVGEVLKNMAVTTARTNKETWAELSGFTHQDNIHDYSIIEKALPQFLGRSSGRSLQAFQPFIKAFKMEAGEDLKPFTTYLTYESWIDDPSPLLRIELIFQEDKLIGVVHSRGLKLPDATDYQLERGFKVLFFNDVAKEHRSAFIKQFNAFINTVD